MRRVQVIRVRNRKTAKARAPWAAGFVKIDAGFLAFESPDDLRLWNWG